MRDVIDDLENGQPIADDLDDNWDGRAVDLLLGPELDLQRAKVQTVMETLCYYGMLFKLISAAHGEESLSDHLDESDIADPIYDDEILDELFYRSNKVYYLWCLMQ